MTKNIFSPLISFFKKLAQANIVFYTVAWLMVLLVLGTVSQRYIGLYMAQNIFFYSWIFWLGPVPLPSGLPTMGLLTLGLIAKLAVATKWRRDQMGIIITHIGALFLMLGGLFTFVGSTDGQITLFPGDRTGYFTAYHDRVLTISTPDKIIQTIVWDDLSPGRTWDIPGTPITLEVFKICRNCAFTPRAENDPNMESLRGRARNFDITPTALEKEDEVNKSAILFRLSGTGTDKDGIHLSADFIDIAPWVTYGEQTYTFALHKKRYSLPFDIELIDFKKSLHPGTDMARAYQSRITIHEPNGTQWSSLVQMNEPLYYRGYTLFQSSYINDGARMGTVLAVVENKGRVFPYLASMIMAVGILLHLGLRVKMIKAIAVAFILGTAFYASPSYAAQPQGPDIALFNQIPIQDQGRIKPMETFAISWLETFSGKNHIGDMTASQWLFDLVVHNTGHDLPIFRVNNPSVRDMLGLPVRKGNRYSYNDILPRLKETAPQWQPMTRIDPAQLSMPQKQLLELVSNIDTYIELSRSLVPALPVFDIWDATLAQKLDVSPDTPQTYLDLVRKKDILTKMFDALEKKAKRSDPTQTMTPTESNLVQIVGQMQEMTGTPSESLFRVIVPVAASDAPESTTWITPWSAVMDKTNADYSATLAPWRAMYQTSSPPHHQVEFNAAVQKIITDTNTRGADQIKATRLSTETLYNKLAPFKVSLWFYIAALAGILACTTLDGAVASKVPLHRLSITLLGAGIICHAAGLVLRMMITGRPPVTNLYDSIIFVGLVGVAIGGILAVSTKQHFYLFAAALIGVVLGLIGLKFDAEGDTMRVLMAVLDTNFWLSTHVVMITFGYGTAILTGILAQFYLGLYALRGRDTPTLPSLNASVFTLSIASLFFTSIGTILGGIWADQSWGRFWGWDPKENGALLIVLWFIWSLHGRYSGHFKNLSFIVVSALLPVVVACAWFGVNLLGVGLHSYGFTQSALVGFTLFCGIQVVFVTVLATFVKWRDPYV